MFKWKSKKPSSGRFVTLMVIPERTHRVHRVIIPSFAIKLVAVFLSLGTLFLAVVSLDYVHVLSKIAENKSLKGENFKLRQEMQLIRNKVDSMESTIERVRNYAKKLQMLTGQGDKSTGELPWGPTDGIDSETRSPASKKDGRRSKYAPPEEAEVMDVAYTPSSFPEMSQASLDSRVDLLQRTTLNTEAAISKLHVNLLAKSAIMDATPSLMPISGWISSNFGFRRNPYDGGYRLHAGVDIAAEPGTPVRAPADGLVIYSGYREGYGKAVVLDHGYGIHTLFAHNSKLFVNAGARIKKGETISQVGNTGHSTGPHLHYEVRKNGIPVNPVPFFSRLRF